MVDVNEQIDVTFDFRSDTPPGGDPDKLSPTLRRYHKFLWSKPLPSGRLFVLDDTTPGAYLHHSSELGEFRLCSDAVIPTFTRWESMKHVTELFSQEQNDAFMAVSYTIGGMIVFPGNRINGRNTINGARGFNGQIADRFDLTLECIRRHYLGEWSPLDETLARYSNFFALFHDFSGYVDFFLLQDLVSEDGSSVKFSMPFDDFKTPAKPQDRATYAEYRCRSIEFIRARNHRIEQYAAGGHSDGGL